MKVKNTRIISIAALILATAVIVSGVHQLNASPTAPANLDNITLVQGISTVTYNTDANDQAIAQKYGLSIDEINKLAEETSLAETYDTDNAPDTASAPANALQLTLQSSEEDDGYYSAQGSINVNGVEDTFFVQGQMHRVELEDNIVCFAGGLSGYLNDNNTPENSLTLSVNYNYTTGDRFITASVGSSMMLDFGKPFDEMTQLYNAISEKP